MSKRQIARATTAFLDARLAYLEAINGDGGHYKAYAEYDAIREELDRRSNAILDVLAADI